MLFCADEHLHRKKRSECKRSVSGWRRSANDWRKRSARLARSKQTSAQQVLSANKTPFQELEREKERLRAEMEAQKKRELDAARAAMSAPKQPTAKMSLEGEVPPCMNTHQPLSFLHVSVTLNELSVVSLTHDLQKMKHWRCSTR
jgi:hypothetical protein